MNKVILIEIVIFLVAAVFGIKWVLNPDGKYEPYITLCLLLLNGIVIWRHHFSNDESYTNETINDDGLSEKLEPKKKNIELTPFTYSNTCAFFAVRFSQAFPGLREYKWFQGKQAVERLQILLAQPLKFSRPDNSWVTPIGWLRGENMTFNDFKVLDNNTVLIDSKELPIKRICAVYTSNYKQLFVYLEADKMPAIGLYEHTPDNFKSTLEYHGYVWEEYGLYKNTHAVTRAEYDDNAAIIMGEPVNLKGQCKIRIRYLTPYNMILTASSSSLNQSSFDETLKNYMDRMLNGEDCIDELINDVKQLPSALGY